MPGPGLFDDMSNPSGMPFLAQAGQYVNPDELIDLFYGNFIREADSGDPYFRKLFGIFDTSYHNSILEISELYKLLWYDECPDKYIYRLLEMIGLPRSPLFESPITSEKERRNFLKYAVWILKRKGTTAALKKIFSILGFSSLIEEDVKENFIVNFHKVFGIDQRTYEIFSDNFNDGNAEGWASQNAGATWEVQSGKYVGLGDGTNNRFNCSVFANSYRRFYFKTDFQVLGGSGSLHPNFGIYLSYNGAYTSSMAVYFYSSGGSDYVKISGVFNGIEIINQSYNITGKVAYKTGVHTLKVYYYNNYLSIAIDETSLITPFYVLGLDLYFPLYYKGLFVNESTEVAFDNVEIRRLKTLGVPVLPGGDSQRLLHIWLVGTPTNAAEKKTYLHDLIQDHFVPAGVEVVWES